jgi:hypothetical protein
VFPEDNIFEAGSATPMGDGVTQHNAKGSERDLFMRIYVTLADKGSAAIDHSNVCMIRLRRRGAKISGVGSNRTLGVEVHERVQVLSAIDAIATVRLNG